MISVSVSKLELDFVFEQKDEIAKIVEEELEKCLLSSNYICDIISLLGQMCT